MSTNRSLVPAMFLLLFAGVAPVARGEEDVADVPSVERMAGGDQLKRYFLIGPANGAGKGPFKLLIVVPGGDGGEGFQPFVKRILKNSLPGDYLIAEPVAVRWSEEQARSLVWPTKTNPWKGMKFGTEEFVDAIVRDVKKVHPIDDRYVFTLSWSSSGPAAYAISLRKKSPVKGSLVAMSVFSPEKLPSLELAKGHAYYLYQSPQDTVCKMLFAKRAREKLSQAGASVELAEYQGGHGWHGDMYGDIRRGVTWLEAHSGKKTDSTATGKGTNEGGQGRKNLLENGDFEKGMEGWKTINNSGRARVDIDEKARRQGGKSLRIEKNGGPPMDVIRYDVEGLPAGGKVTVSAAMKSAGAKNGFLKFFVYDASGGSLVEDVDIARVSGTGGWKRYQKTFDVPENAASGAVMFVMVLDGRVWLDDVRVEK